MLRFGYPFARRLTPQQAASGQTNAPKFREGRQAASQQAPAAPKRLGLRSCSPAAAAPPTAESASPVFLSRRGNGVNRNTSISTIIRAAASVTAAA